MYFVSLLLLINYLILRLPSKAYFIQNYFLHQIQDYQNLNFHKKKIFPKLKTRAIYPQKNWLKCYFDTQKHSGCLK